MNLLPKSNQDFSQKDYWNTFFQRRGKKAFEWYGEYHELCGHLHKYIKSKDNILIVGCGNSKLGMDLYDVGYKKIINIDISQLAINNMISLNKIDRNDLKFLQMDATAMTFENEEFSVVLDKGTLDALFTDNSDNVRELIDKYLNEIGRVLRNGGRYVCISLLQEHIIRYLVEYFPKHNWMFRVVRCLEVDQKSNENDNDDGDGDGNSKQNHPVFIIIATKFKQMAIPPILEICLDGTDKMQRMTNANDLSDAIIEVQRMALICNGLQRNTLTDSDEIVIHLYRPDGADNDTPRFTIHILDQKPQRDNGKFAAFIVPQGREPEWLFSTIQGRRKLMILSKFNRLAIVSMHREQTYKTWDDVKSELSQSIKNLAPINDQRQHGQIPFLSIGSDVGERNVLFTGNSKISGDFIVEEIKQDDGKYYRRLIFLNNQFVIQSQALIKFVQIRNKKEVIIDPNYLACKHHLYMTIGVHIGHSYAASMMVARNNNNNNNKKKLKNKNVSHSLVIGLGGGGLCTFMQQCLSKLNIIAIDIDPAMLLVATNYFGLNQNERLDVIIQDGLEFIKSAAQNDITYNSILFDVDNKDSSVGISCPPKQFLDLNLLHLVKKCIGEQGIFILNLVCRDEQLKKDIFTDLKIVFPSVCSYQVEDELNIVIFCQNIPEKDPSLWNSEIKKSSEYLNEITQKNQKNDLYIEIDELLNDLKI